MNYPSKLFSAAFLICLLLALPPAAQALTPEIPFSQALPEETKAPGTATVSQKTIVYGVDRPSPVFSSETNDSEPYLLYKIQGSDDRSYGPEPPTEAGVYTVRVTYPETDTHLEATAAADFTIRARITGISLAPVTPSRTYNGSTLPLPLEEANLPFQFTVAGTAQVPQPGHDYFVSGTLLSPKVDLDPESKNLKLSLTFPEGLYALAPEAETEFYLHADIQKAPLTIIARDQARKSGFSDSLDQVIVEGLLPGDRLADLTLSPSADGSALLPLDAMLFRDREEVTDQYAITYQAGTLTHQGKITAEAAPAEGLVYSGQAQSLLSFPGESNGGPLLYQVSYTPISGGEEIQLSPWSQNLPQGISPGIYRIAYKAPEGILKESPEKTLTVTMAPKELQVEARGKKIYDGTRELGEADITLFVPEGQILPGESVTVKSIQGSRFSQALPCENQKVTPGNVVLEGEDAGNYHVTVSSFTGSILPRPVTVKAQPAEKAYGAEDPALPYRAQGLLPSDRLKGSLTRSPGEAPGSYAITQGSLRDKENPGYHILFASAPLKITPGAQALSLSFSKPRVRPGKDLTLEITSRNRTNAPLEGGWSQPGQITLTQGTEVIPPQYLGGGRWQARYQVPKDAEGSLTFTLRSEDPNYEPLTLTGTVTVGGFLSANPQTGDRILVYGTLLTVSALLLLGIGILWYNRKK